MAIPALADAAIDRDSPLKTTTVMEALRDRDDYTEVDATNGGAGIEPTVQGFLAAFGAHTHDGTDGQGENIDSPGIAANAANEPDMFQDDCVSTAKIASNTLETSDLDNGAVTVAKMSGDMGWALSGSLAWDTGGIAVGDDEVFLGDTMAISHGKGTEGVICNRKVTASGNIDFFVRRVTSTQVFFGLRSATYVSGATGTWHVDCKLL